MTIKIKTHKNEVNETKRFCIHKQVGAVGLFLDTY